LRLAIFTALFLTAIAFAPSVYGQPDDMSNLRVSLEHDPQYLDIDTITNLGTGIDDYSEVSLNVQTWPSNLTNGSYSGATFIESTLELDYTPSSVADVESFFAIGQDFNFSNAELLNGATEFEVRTPFVGDDFYLSWLAIYERGVGYNELALNTSTYHPTLTNATLVYIVPLINNALDLVGSQEYQDLLTHFDFNSDIWPLAKYPKGSMMIHRFGEFNIIDERIYYRINKYLYPDQDYYIAQSVWLNVSKPKIALTEEITGGREHNISLIWGESYPDDTNTTKNASLNLSAGFSFVFKQGHGNGQSGSRGYKNENQALFFRARMSRVANGSENISLMLPFINHDNKDLNVTFRITAYDIDGNLKSWIDPATGNPAGTQLAETGPINYRNFILYTPQYMPDSGSIWYYWRIYFTEPANLTYLNFDGGGEFIVFEGITTQGTNFYNNSYHNFSLYHSLQYTDGAWVMVETQTTGDITVLDPRFPVVIGQPAQYDLELSIDNGNIETVSLFDEALQEWSQIDLKDPLGAVQHILNGVSYFIAGTLQAVRDEATAITGWVRGGFGWLKDQLDSLGQFVYLGLLELKKLILSLIPDIIEGLTTILGMFLTVAGLFLAMMLLKPVIHIAATIQLNIRKRGVIVE